MPSSSAPRTVEKLRGCSSWSGKALRVQLPLNPTYFMPGSALHMFESTLSVPEPGSVTEFNSSSLRGPGVAVADSASPACIGFSKPGLRSWRSLLRAGARPAPARPSRSTEAALQLARAASCSSAIYSEINSLSHFFKNIPNPPSFPGRWVSQLSSAWPCGSCSPLVTDACFPPPAGKALAKEGGEKY